ncbi:Alpha N-terminal protein methyltransferase 1 [Pleurostoma richardsiae]|uniref:Alpha N-terminal protein methyltransferase 1 n=1 Tax=Pleurostoma richardsiae TaxID=41990 RepID=A0AA38R7F4_9PEZI|nr:Alpha N-terminal protein methyltransferase 1 [Pleurostoma richardsiae]
MSEPDSGPAPAPDALINTSDGLQYWESISADVNGMLGGFPHISTIDLRGSQNFLAKLGIGIKEGLRVVGSALEGGAGIGRITEGLLLKVAEEVDVIEPVAKFTEALREKGSVRSIFNVGLERWRPDEGAKYDLIWVQWCVGHLTDEQLVRFLKTCKGVLQPDGLIIVKENLSTSGKDLFDDVDSSVTRVDAKFQSLFKQAGLKIVKTEIQRGFPRELFPVCMYAMKPV